MITPTLQRWLSMQEIAFELPLAVTKEVIRTCTATDFAVVWWRRFRVGNFFYSTSSVGRTVTRGYIHIGGSMHRLEQEAPDQLLESMLLKVEGESHCPRGRQPRHRASLASGAHPAKLPDCLGSCLPTDCCLPVPLLSVSIIYQPSPDTLWPC